MVGPLGLEPRTKGFAWSRRFRQARTISSPGAITDKLAPVRRKVAFSESTCGNATLAPCFLLVHATYVFRAAAPQSQPQPGCGYGRKLKRQTSLRLIFVIIRDPEQESALLEQPFMELKECPIVLPQDNRKTVRVLDQRCMVVRLRFSMFA
jgi:hypothetical protein